MLNFGLLKMLQIGFVDEKIIILTKKIAFLPVNEDKKGRILAL